jgi:hypothetical protein
VLRIGGRCSLAEKNRQLSEAKHCNFFKNIQIIALFLIATFAKYGTNYLVHFGSNLKKNDPNEKKIMSVCSFE